MKIRKSATQKRAETAMHIFKLYQNGIAAVTLKENKQLLQIEADNWMETFLKNSVKERGLFNELGFG